MTQFGERRAPKGCGSKLNSEMADENTELGAHASHEEDVYSSVVTFRWHALSGERFDICDKSEFGFTDEDLASMTTQEHRLRRYPRDGCAPESYFAKIRRGMPHPEQIDLITALEDDFDAKMPDEVGEETALIDLCDEYPIELVSKHRQESQAAYSSSDEVSTHVITHDSVLLSLYIRRQTTSPQ